MKTLVNMFRIILGIVFVFSGFVKVVDPMGVEFKFVDYFVAMGLDFLEPAAFTFGIIMSVAELLIGISLLFNLKPKSGSWGVMLFMIVFLPLTLWIAIADPVQDCGCFGDAIILSNWATFWKNVVIMAMTVPVFLKRKDFKTNLPQSMQWTLLIVFSVATVWLSIYCYRHLPILDFRPYRIGNNIQAGMEIPDSEKEIQPQNVGLIYEKNGESKEFTLFDLPLTSEWRFVDAVYYNPETAVTPDNKTPEDITDLVLKDDRYTFFIISWDILKVKNKNIENLIKLYNYCDVNNMGCLFMTSSTEEDVKTFVKEKDAPFEFYSTDPITLKTMARSNPSILLVKKATILNKWPHKDFPGVDKLSDLLVAQSMEKQVVKSEKFLVWMIGFGIFLLYALIHIFINYLRRKNILNEKRSWE